MAFFLVSMHGIQMFLPMSFITPKALAVFGTNCCLTYAMFNDYFYQSGYGANYSQYAIPAAIVTGRQRIHNEAPLRRVGTR